ncbi:Essential protein Yae1, N-terminal [Dillenia turbinata]|uniref:Essential protein Yae1, N-terminal n=1 Tax=Dillenia turbinata TaxID=194707 RepID=A0AAN8V172_9MAGN
MAEDIFDSALNLEESHLQQGYNEGYADGLKLGKQEGVEVGLKLGFQSGEELGFYRGCIDLWNSVISISPKCHSARVLKMIKRMDELLDKYPILDPETESVQDLMDNLRLKFRAVCASMSIKLEYDGYPKSSEQIEF